MKRVLNVLLILAFAFNQAVFFHPVQAAVGQSQPAAKMPQADLSAGDAARATPTPIPTTGSDANPTAMPTAVVDPLPPAPTNRLSLKTNLNCVTPGQDLALDWDFQPAPEWAGRESELELVVTLPPAFTPATRGVARFDAKTGVARAQLSKTGKLQGKLADKISDDLTVTAKVVSGEKVVAETTLQLGQGSVFNLPVNGGEAASPSGRFKVTIPEGALDEGVSLCLAKGANADSGEPLSVTAEGKGSKSAVRHFNKNIQLSYQLTPGEFGGDEASLSFMYFDEAKQNWQYLPSEVDPVNHIVTGYSNHLTDFNVGINSVDQYKISDLSAFNVSEFMGSGTYSLPLQVPPGPAGFAPSLNLSYSSAISDAAGFRTQGSWVGMGWNLEVGTIIRSTQGTNDIKDDTFSLMLAGQSLSLQPYQRGTDTTGGVSKPYVEYQGQNTNFWRVRRYIQYNRENAECFSGGSGNRDYTDISYWKVWDKEGNVYTFDERQVYLSGKVDYCRNDRNNYKWFLTSAKNPSGQEINFDYIKTTAQRDAQNDGKWSSTDDVEVALHQIRYANNRYLIHFKTGDRNDWTDACLGYFAACTVDRKKLDEIQMYYNPSGQAITHDGNGNLNMTGLEQIRRYVFSYFTDSTSPLYPYMTWTHDSITGHTLTLKSVQEFGTSTASLPETTFTYDEMHLTDVTNGYNGKVHLVYETNPWPAEGVANGVVEGQARVYRWFGDTQSLTALYSDPWWTQVMPTCCSGHYNRIAPIAPGKMVWMRLSTHTDQGNRNLSFYIQNNDTFGVIGRTINNVNGEWAVVLKMPQNITGRIYFRFEASSDILVWNEAIGTAVTRYRVKERWFYRDATVTAPDVYKYDYTENGVETASTNTPALSDLSASDFVEGKVTSKPYTEFRGHGTVTVTNDQDHSKTVTHYYQKDGLVGQVKDSTFYRKDTNGVYHKISATIMGDGTANSDYYKEIIQRPTPDTLLDNPNTSEDETVYTRCGIICKDNTIYWTSPKLVEKRIYNPADESQYTATRTAYNYGLSALSTATPPSLPPVYELRSAVESEKSSSGWTVVRKKFSTYTATDVNSDIRYFVGHPSSTATCSSNGNEANAEYLICGTSASDYYGFAVYAYNEKGQVSAMLNQLSFTGVPTTTHDTRYSYYASYLYDDYGNVNMVSEGYKNQTATRVIQKTTIFCYRAETADRTANPPCTDYTGAGVNGVYLSWVKNSLSQVTHYVNDARLGQSSKQIDPNGAETSVTYDEFGRLSTARKPGDSGATPTLQFTYNLPAAGVSSFFWTEATQKLDETKTLKVRKFYNGIGELIQTQQAGVKVNDPACSAETCVVVTDQKTEYVSGVKTTTQTAPYAVATPTGSIYVTPTWQNATVTTYDAEGRPLMVKAPSQTAATSQRFSYGLDGTLLKTTTTDPNNNITESWQDVWGRTRQVKAADGPVLVYNYDIANRLTSVEQRNRSNNNLLATTSLTYDVAGRKTQMIDPDMGTWVYRYDAYGNLVWQVDARSQQICLYYDALNRLTGKEYRKSESCSGANLAVTYTYDQTADGNKGVGRRTAMNDLSGSTTWKYDERGRLLNEVKSINGAGTFKTQWTYNSADQVATMIYPGGADGSAGEVVTNTYNAQMAMTGVSGTDMYLYDATYDAAGRVKTRKYGTTQKLESFTYYPWDNNLGLLQQHTLDGFNLLNLMYSDYDKNGNILTINDNSLITQTFTYDALNRLSSTKTCLHQYPDVCDYNDTGYSYDNYGRLTTKPGGGTLTYADPNHIHAVTSATDTSVTPNLTSTYSYDVNGNTIARDNVPTGSTTKSYTLVYDAENRLVDVSNGAVAGFIYDGDGNRVLGTVDGVSTVYIGNYYEAQLGQAAQRVANPSFKTQGAAPYTSANWTQESLSMFPATSFFRSSWGLGVGNNDTYGQAISNLAYGIIRSDVIPVTHDVQYDLYAYVRGRIDPEESIAGWCIRAFFYDDNNNWVSQVDVAGSKTISETWLQKGGTLTVPTNARKLRIGLYAAEISGWVAFDDVSLVLKGTTTNLAANPGFESGSGFQAANWSGFDETGGKFPATGYFRFTWGIAEPHPGTGSSYAYAISNLAFSVLQSDLITSQVLPDTQILPNTQYDLYAYVRGALDAGVSTRNWILRAKYYNAAGTLLSIHDVAGATPLTTDWQRFGGRLTTPANTAKIQVALMNYMSSGWVAFDDVSLVKVGGSTNLVPNPGFETGNEILPANWTKDDPVNSSFPASSSWRGTWGITAPHSENYAYATGNLAFGDLKADPVAALPNTQYDLSAYVQSYRDLSASWGYPILRVVALDSNNNQLTWDDLAGPNITNSYSYQKYGGRFITPANTAKLRVEVHFFMSTGWAVFDDVSLTPVQSSLTSFTKYYYAGGQRIARRTGTGSVEYLFSDHLGSSSLVVDSTLTNKITRMYYTAWGKLLFPTGTAPAANAFTYTGQRQEAGIALNFYNARWYDPNIAHFAQADTMVPNPGSSKAWDRYAYVNNNPVNGTDPTGHTCEDSYDPACRNWDQANPYNPELEAERIRPVLRADPFSGSTPIKTTNSLFYPNGNVGYAEKGDLNYSDFSTSGSDPNSEASRRVDQLGLANDGLEWVRDNTEIRRSWPFNNQTVSGVIYVNVKGTGRTNVVFSGVSITNTSEFSNMKILEITAQSSWIGVDGQRVKTDVIWRSPSNACTTNGLAYPGASASVKFSYPLSRGQNVTFTINIADDAGWRASIGQTISYPIPHK